MERKKVTILAIAKEIGMSRNTVSKALNDDPTVSDKTKEIVITKAKEMNYKGIIPNITKYAETINNGKSIVFITKRFSDTSSFWPLVWNGIESKISNSNNDFSITMVSSDDIENLRIPNVITSSNIDGILCSEIFDKSYIQALVNTGLPLVFIDSYYDAESIHTLFDTVIMENSQSITRLTKHLMNLGHTKIGFAGKYDYCRSFFERYVGFNQAFNYSGLNPPHEFDLIPEEDSYEVEWIIEKLKSLKEMPTALVCANDYIAINVMKAAKEMGLNLPDDLSVTGFDDLKEATTVEPHLTTVQIDTEALGYRAVEVLLWRMNNLTRPFEVTHIENKIIFRDSVKIQ